MGDIVSVKTKAIRAALKDLPTHEELRQQINPAHQIEKLNSLIDVVETNASMVGIGVPLLDQSQLMSIKMAMDARLKLLDKSLPSLKSVEVKADGEKGQRITFIMGQFDGG